LNELAREKYHRSKLKVMRWCGTRNGSEGITAFDLRIFIDRRIHPSPGDFLKTAASRGVR
jgi:hypothetical protein